jgi:hypothetical protein
MRINKNTKLSTASCALAVTLAVLQGCGGGGSPASTSAAPGTGAPGAGAPPAPVSETPAGTPPAPVGGTPPAAAIGGLPATFTAAFAEKDGTTFYTFNGDGTSANSSDGITWTTSAVTGLVGARVVRKLNGSWIAVGLNGGIFTSPNGITWTARASGISNVYIHNVAFGGGRYVAVASPDGANKNVTTSADGVTWTSASIGTNIVLLGVTYLDGKFYAAGYEDILGASRKGELYSSADGLTWVRKPLPIVPGLGIAAPVQSLSSKGSTLVAASNFGVVYTSSDSAATFAQVEAPTSRNLLNVVCSATLCVAVSSSQSPDVSVVVTSANLSQWSRWSTASTQDLRGLSYNGTRWTVTGGSGFSAWSDDAINWTANPIK